MFIEFSVVGLAPAALVVLAGIYVRARQADGKLARRWLLFLFAVTALAWQAWEWRGKWLLSW